MLCSWPMSAIGPLVPEAFTSRVSSISTAIMNPNNESSSHQTRLLLGTIYTGLIFLAFKVFEKENASLMNKEYIDTRLLPRNLFNQ